MNGSPKMQAARFRWDNRSVLFANTQKIARPQGTHSQSFCPIIHSDLAQTVTSLGAAIRASSPFCISDRPLKDLHADDGDFLTFTGGSSGQPKVIRRTQASWIHSFEVNQKLFQWAPEQPVATLGTPVHSLALYATLEALHLGRHMHVLAGLSPTKTRAHLAKHAIQTLYATPAQLRVLCSGKPKTALHSLTLILCGGGMLDEATQTATQLLCTNARIHQFYGAAETSFITMTDATTPRGSVGKAYPGATLELRDATVWVRSPYLFKDYANPDLTSPRCKDGFVSVGELGKLDADGNLWLLGRKDRVVQIADQNISPEQIEQFIMRRADVEACAVLPVPDTLRGHQLAALIYAPTRMPSVADLKAACQQAFGPLVAPRHFILVADWPTLPSGKPDLLALAKLLETAT